MARGAGVLRCGSPGKAVSVSFGGWVRAGGFVIFECWGAGVSVGCRRLVRACLWALAGWGRRRLWKGDPVIQSGLWRMVGRMSFWELGVDPLDGIFDGQGCDVFGNI